MCARRFLILIFILILLSVAGAFALFQFGDRALTSFATPKGSFEPPPPRTGPDYSDAANWIARPGIMPNPGEWRPDGWPPPILRPRQAHAFFIHPTTYLERDRWNALLDDPGSRGRAELFTRSQASAFNGVADIWAPRYRQAAFGAFLLDSADAAKALHLAYGDVERAFDAFVAAVPAGEPIILAGHSQGALHLSRLLREKVAGTPIANRIVAAYVVGWPLSLQADIPAMGLPACRAAEEAGCIFSWQSFMEPANTSMIRDAYEKPALADGGHRRLADMLCTNPISGTLGGAAPPSANLGTLVPTPDLASAKLSPGLVGARCTGGFLIIDGAIPPLGPYVLPGNNYHVYDYALFWGSIRADAERRTAAFAR
ncbi:MAG: DUF3089 domain-containing protein [Pseudomonadota bacterium]|nr:DUF3089 domain-containing protein [Pseudomonadota bacterium]